MSLTEIQKTFIYYETHGQGHPLVLIRGLGSNADHWYSQLPAFLSNFQTIVFDNRGIGRSPDPGGEFSIDSMVRDTIGVLDSLNLEKFHLLGLSMGGMIAQELAIQYPERVKGLILACTHPGRKWQEYPVKEEEEIFLKMVYEANPQSKLDAMPILFDPENLKKQPGLAEEYGSISLRYPADAKILIKQWEAVLNHNAFERLNRITSPTLVLTGDADRLIPRGNAELLCREISGSRLAVVPGGGHQILVEKSRTCNRIILDFLSSLDD